MDENNYWAKLYLQQKATINGHGVFHYLIDTAIGQLHIVEFEDYGMEIKRFIIDCDNDKAERKYTSCCKYVLAHFPA